MKINKLDYVRTKAFTTSELKYLEELMVEEGYNLLERVTEADCCIWRSYGVGGEGDYYLGGWIKDYTEDMLHVDTTEIDIMEVSYMGETLWKRVEDTPEQKRIKELEKIISDAKEELESLKK